MIAPEKCAVEGKSVFPDRDSAKSYARSKHQEWNGRGEGVPVFLRGPLPRHALTHGTQLHEGRQVMQYMGGKHRTAREIVEAIQRYRNGRPHYLEPFLGGANIFPRVAPEFVKAVASDAMPDVIALWQAVRDGWEPPHALTEQEWRELRDAEPSALRAFAGFGCSFGGRFFEGYARNRSDNHTRGEGVRDYAATARRGILRKAEGLRGARIELRDYRLWAPGPDAVVYCDPPYEDTKPFSGMDPWDAEEFWDTAERWARGGAAVLVSEYRAPAGWSPVWSRVAQQSIHKGRNVLAPVESVFMLDGHR